MSHSNRISARAMLAVAALAFTPGAWALGLGDVTVESYLNQPLRARIDLIRNAQDDLSTITARLASAEDYQMIGASLEDLSVPIRFSVEDIEGEPHLLATSNLPLSNPIVRLIVEVDWANGRMLREYTLFLDPPMVADTAPQAVPLPKVDLRETAPAAARVDEPAEPETAPEVAATTAAPAPAPRRVPATGEYGPVASGETLWGIASNWSRGAGIDINRAMIAIQRANPDAFLNGNINLLKRGAILRMPAVSEVEQVTRSEAYSEVAEQQAEFTGQRAVSAARSGGTPLLSEQAAVPQPEPEPALPAEDLYASPQAESTVDEAADAGAAEAAPVASVEPEPDAADQLKLVPPSEDSELDSTYGFEESEEAGDASVATQALRENLARTEEELIAEQQQNAYLEDRIRELEAQLEEAQKDAVADSDLANMEQRLREEREAENRAAEPEAWYVRYGAWLLGLLVVVAAAVGWRVSRRSARSAEEEAALRELADEAEEVLRVLDDKDGGAGAAESQSEESEKPAAKDEPRPEPDTDEAKPAEAEAKEGAGKRVVKPFGGAQEDADVLDEESSDPEIQLDLARAYISMGDKEAARVILEEVASNGSEEQQAEARKMLDLM